MAYLLEKRIVQSEGKSPHILWKRYAVCGRPELLERVRMGQKRPELWRVVWEHTCTALPFPMKKAG